MRIDAGGVRCVPSHNDGHHFAYDVEEAIVFRSGAKAPIYHRRAHHRLYAVDDAEDGFFHAGELGAAPRYQAAHRVRDDDDAALGYEIPSFLIPVEHFVNTIFQGLGGLLVTLHPVVAAGPHRVVIIVHAGEFVFS